MPSEFLLKIFPTITSDESQIAHKLFLLMLFVIIATLIERFLQGCVASYEQFVVFNSIGVIRLLVKLFLTIVFLIKGSGLVGIVLVDIIAISLKDVLENLGAITGQEAGEEIINEIFARFCLGK